MILPLLVVPLHPAHSSDDRGVFWFEWTESASAADPWVSEATPQAEDREVYLWMSMCAAHCVKRVEFSFVGDLEVVSLSPVAGFTNLGTATSPVLEHESCFRWEPQLAATLVIRDPDLEGGNLCFTEALQTNRNCTATCDAQESLYRHWYQGFATDGTWPCYGESTTLSCERIVSVDAAHWGRIKAKYYR